MCLTLLQLKLEPSSVARRFVLFLVLRSCALVAAVCCVLLSPVVFGVVSLVVFALVQVGFYFYVQRLVLCIFQLAQKVEEAGQPVGRPVSRKVVPKKDKAIDLVSDSFI